MAVPSISSRNDSPGGRKVFIWSAETGGKIVMGRHKAVFWVKAKAIWYGKIVDGSRKISKRVEIYGEVRLAEGMIFVGL